MKKHQLLLVLFASFLGLLLFSFNGNTKVKADDPDWQSGVPEFLNDDNYVNKYGGELSYDDDSDTLRANSSQNIVGGNDLMYYRASKHVYYIYASNDEGDDSVDDYGYVQWIKIRTLSGDRLRIYYSNDDDGADMTYWGTYTAE